jgi:hypothetical protein
MLDMTSLEERDKPAMFPRRVLGDLVEVDLVRGRGERTVALLLSLNCEASPSLSSESEVRPSSGFGVFLEREPDNKEVVGRRTGEEFVLARPPLVDLFVATLFSPFVSF